ncbi:MAG: M48 family metallopeptidase [Planctomycetes bacterium]|nr:M48 family metallopeptidase [Planctomycetota bacterium]
MARKNPSLAGRALLAIVLMAGFYLLALAICGTLAWLCWVDLQTDRVHPKLWIIAAVTIGVVVWSVWPRRAKLDDPGVPLTREDQPRLWQLVESIAERCEQEPPRHIFLVPEINAFVGERNGRLGFGGERIMGIGLPLLQVLTLPQVKSVIAHEFGHFHGGDTRLGPFVYKTREAIGRTVQNFARTESLLGKPFEWYGTLFLRATFGISRAQEFAADALAVQLVGLEPAQTALRRVNEVGPLYDHYLEEEYFPMLNRGIRPPLADGFEAFLRSERIQKVQLDLGEGAMQAKGNPYDSHPPLSERLRAAAEVDDPGDEPAAGEAAIALLDDVPELEGRLLAFLTGRDDVRQIPAAAWTDSGKAHAVGWHQFAAEHGSRIPPLRAEQFAGCDEQLGAVVKVVDPSVPLEHRKDAGAWMVATLLGSALVRAGFEVRTAPGEPLDVVRGEMRFQPYALAQELREGKLDDAWWRSRCRSAGIEGLVLSGPELPPFAPNETQLQGS